MPWTACQPPMPIIPTWVPPWGGGLKLPLIVRDDLSVTNGPFAWWLLCCKRFGGIDRAADCAPKEASERRV